MSNLATDEQPTPKGIEVDITSLVIKDMGARARLGEQRYGERLKPFNGRNALVDAYQEILDLAVYLRQEIYEKEHGKRIQR